MKKSFVLYTDQKNVFEALPDAEVKEVLLAIFDYAEGTEKTLSPLANIAFISIKNTLKRDFEKWEHNSQIRKEYGRMGGLAKASKSYLKPVLLSKPAVSVSDSVSVNNNIESNSKNSLLPLTKQDRIDLALSLRVEIADIHRYEQDVLNPENISKYGYKTTFHTVKKWINRAISKGTQRTLDATGMMVLEGLYGKGAQL